METIERIEENRYIFSQLEIDENISCLEPWAAQAYKDYVEFIEKAEFPCYFAAQGLRRKSFSYCLIDPEGKGQSLSYIYESLSDYMERLKGLTIEEEKWRILIVFVRNDDSKALGDDHQKAWSIIQKLHDLDSTTWPDHVPRNIDDPKWSFCFAGREIFVNVSSTHHKNRSSRNLGRSLTLLFQPRTTFDNFDQKIKKDIRRRVTEYDQMEVSPTLIFYGKEGSKEKHQYTLPDKNEDKLIDYNFNTRRD